MSAIIFDPDVIQETDKLRGSIPRSRYVNTALREHNKRMAIINQKLAEAEREMDQKEQRMRALLQNSSSSVGRHVKSSADTLGLFPSSSSSSRQVNSPQHQSSITANAEDAEDAVPESGKEDAVPVE